MWMTLVCVLLGAAAQAPSPAEPGSRLTFLGWSPDSRLVAYTRERGGRAATTQRMHRFVRDGAFAGFGRMVGGDVGAYAREHGYVASPAARRSETARRWQMQVGERLFTLAFEIGREVRWTFGEGERVLARHTFDRIYIGFEPELYPSPDGRQGVLVMHLDTGWQIDAAIFPVPLQIGER